MSKLGHRALPAATQCSAREVRHPETSPTAMPCGIGKERHPETIQLRQAIDTEACLPPSHVVPEKEGIIVFIAPLTTTAAIDT